MRICKEAIRFTLASLFLTAAAPAWAGIIQGTHGLNGLGSFEANLSYSATSLDPTRAVLRIELRNTTPIDRGGYLTAFAWNNPGQHITGIEDFDSTSPHFHPLGGPGFNNGVTGAPFGLFDLGVSTGNSWEGGGNPHRGLAPGSSSTSTFNLLGHDLDDLTEQSFLQELSAPERDGRGAKAFVARFRGFENCNPDSDKTPNDPPPIMHFPEPSSFALAGIGVVGVAGIVGWRRWKKKSDGMNR